MSYDENRDPTGEGADAMYDVARDKAHEAGFKDVGEYLDAVAQAADQLARDEEEVFDR